MYQLMVLVGGDPVPREIETIARAADVLARIPALMTEHEGCEYVVVTANGVRLFAVDCAGNKLP